MAADPLQRFHPDIAKFVEAVLNNGGFGVCGELPKIADPKTSLSSPRAIRSCDRFKVLIPYAGRNLKCKFVLYVYFVHVFSVSNEYRY